MLISAHNYKNYSVIRFETKKGIKSVAVKNTKITTIIKEYLRCVFNF